MYPNSHFILIRWCRTATFSAGLLAFPWYDLRKKRVAERLKATRIFPPEDELTPRVRAYVLSASSNLAALPSPESSVPPSLLAKVARVC